MSETKKHKEFWVVNDNLTNPEQIIGAHIAEMSEIEVCFHHELEVFVNRFNPSFK